MADLEDHADDAEQEQDVGQFRLGDQRQQLGAPTRRYKALRQAGGGKRHGRGAEGHLAPVGLGQHVGDIGRHEVRHAPRHRLIGRQARRLANGLFSPVGVAAAQHEKFNGPLRYPRFRPRAPVRGQHGVEIGATEAEGAHRGGHQHSQERGVRQQGYRHEDRRRSNGYGGDEDYVYGAPPIVYAPEAAPGVNLFLPL